MYGEDYTVCKLLGEGGRAKVYLVKNENGDHKVLKWMKKFEDNKIIFANIKEKICTGILCEEFLWPEDMTDWIEDEFGYIMDVIPEGYYDISEYLLKRQMFDSYRVVVEAALHIVTAFRKLHLEGYCYQCLDCSNFFIHPNHGKVYICSTEDIVPSGMLGNIWGNPRYMAPEKIVKENVADRLTDIHSMTVILFLIFCNNHPLEGKRWREVELTDEAQKKLYGSEALFIFDPNDQSNKAEQIINANAISVWNVLPNYMKDLFLKAFSKEALLENPNARPEEVEWINALVRFRSEIVACSCGNEIFVEQGLPCVCECCGKKAEIPFRLEFERYSIPGIAGNRIYQCQLGTCRVEEALMPVGLVIAKKDNAKVLGIRNVSITPWKAWTPSGKEKMVQPNEVVPLMEGIVIEIGAEIIKIRANE